MVVVRLFGCVQSYFWVSVSPLCLAPALYLRLENKKKVDLTLINVLMNARKMLIFKPPRGIFYTVGTKEVVLRAGHPPLDYRVK